MQGMLLGSEPLATSLHPAYGNCSTVMTLRLRCNQKHLAAKNLPCEWNTQIQ